MKEKEKTEQASEAADQAAEESEIIDLVDEVPPDASDIQSEIVELSQRVDSGEKPAAEDVAKADTHGDTTIELTEPAEEEEIVSLDNVFKEPIGYDNGIIEITAEDLIDDPEIETAFSAGLTGKPAPALSEDKANEDDSDLNDDFLSELELDPEGSAEGSAGVEAVDSDGMASEDTAQEGDEEDSLLDWEDEMAQADSQAEPTADEIGEDVAEAVEQALADELDSGFDFEESEEESEIELDISATDTDADALVETTEELEIEEATDSDALESTLEDTTTPLETSEATEPEIDKELDLLLEEDETPEDSEVDLEQTPPSEAALETPAAPETDEEIDLVLDAPSEPATPEAETVSDVDGDSDLVLEEDEVSEAFEMDLEQTPAVSEVDKELDLLFDESDDLDLAPETPTEEPEAEVDAELDLLLDEDEAPEGPDADLDEGPVQLEERIEPPEDFELDMEETTPPEKEADTIAAPGDSDLVELEKSAQIFTAPENEAFWKTEVLAGEDEEQDLKTPEEEEEESAILATRTPPSDDFDLDELDELDALLETTTEAYTDLDQIDALDDIIEDTQVPSAVQEPTTPVVEESLTAEDIPVEKMAPDEVTQPIPSDQPAPPPEPAAQGPKVIPVLPEIKISAPTRPRESAAPDAVPPPPADSATPPPEKVEKGDLLESSEAEIRAELEALTAAGVSEEQVERALEHVIRKLYADKISLIMNDVIEKTVTKEIQRIKDLLLEEKPTDDT